MTSLFAKHQDQEVNDGINRTAPVNRCPDWDSVDHESGFQVLAQLKGENSPLFEVTMTTGGWVGNDDAYRTAEVDLFAFNIDVNEFWLLDL
jgi:hypothetical protein